MKPLRSSCWVGLALSFLLPACTASDPSFDLAQADPAVAQVQGAVEVAPNVVEVTPADFDHASVTKSGISFFYPNRRLLQVRQGMSIVGVLDGEPMLRKVTRVDWWEDGSLYFATKDVSLTDVVRKAHADRRVVDLHPFEFKRNDLKLAEGEGVNITCTTCELTFDPKLEYQFDLTPDAVESLGLALKGKLVGDVAVDIASPEGRSTLSREVVLANKTDRFVQRLGPIPIWEDTSISLIATIKGKTNGEAHVLSKLHVEKDIAFGSFLEQGQWVVEEAPEEGTYVYEHPVLEAKVDGSVSVALKLRLSASVVGIASAKVDADADASANLQICPMPSTWTMQGKLKISAGAKLAIPFMDPYEIDKEIYRKEGTREVKSPSNAPALCR